MQIKYSEMEFIFIELQKLIDATAPIKLSGVPDFSALQSIELPTAKEMAEQEIEICKLMKLLNDLIVKDSKETVASLDTFKKLDAGISKMFKK